jgi:hypothetical protein
MNTVQAPQKVYDNGFIDNIPYWDNYVPHRYLK